VLEADLCRAIVPVRGAHLRFSSMVLGRGRERGTWSRWREGLILDGTLCTLRISTWTFLGDKVGDLTSDYRLERMRETQSPSYKEPGPRKIFNNQLSTLDLVAQPRRLPRHEG